MLRSSSLALLVAAPLTAACASAQPIAVQPAVTQTTIPMTFATGRPAVEAVVAGRTTIIAFDTGGQSAIIPQSMATELDLQVVGETLVGSPYGGEPIRANIVALGNVSIGGIAVSDATAVVLDDARFPANERRLIIGSGQFTGHVITLNFVNSTLSLSTEPPAEQTGWQPLDERNFMRTELLVGGQSVPVIIDSGNPRGLVLPLDTLDRIAPGVEPVQVGEVRTVDRVVPRYAADINAQASVAGIALRLGRVELAPVPVGNMGSAALSGMQLIIDMPRRRWRLNALIEQPISVSTPRQ